VNYSITELETIIAREGDPKKAAKKIAEIYLPEVDKEKKFHPKASEILASIRLHTKNNKIKSAELEHHFNISGDQLRETVINPFRRMGEFICSDNSGYWYGSPQEAEECALFLRNRAHKVLSAAEGMLGAISRTDKDLFGEKA
jgi:hypothetical protein